MPDDSQQKEHAQSIATERYLTQQWGVPRNQVRQRLHDIAVDMAAQRAAAQATAQATTSAPAPFPAPGQIQTDSRSFDPRPLTLAIDPTLNPNIPPSSGQGSGGQLDQVIIVFNGTADYCTLNGQITGPV